MGAQDAVATTYVLRRHRGRSSAARPPLAHGDLSPDVVGLSQAVPHLVQGGVPYVKADPPPPGQGQGEGVSAMAVAQCAGNSLKGRLHVALIGAPQSEEV